MHTMGGHKCTHAIQEVPRWLFKVLCPCASYISLLHCCVNPQHKHKPEHAKFHPFHLCCHTTSIGMKDEEVCWHRCILQLLGLIYMVTKTIQQGEGIKDGWIKAFSMLPANQTSNTISRVFWWLYLICCRKHTTVVYVPAHVIKTQLTISCSLCFKFAASIFNAVS